MPFLAGGGIFIPTNRQYHLGEEVFMTLRKTCAEALAIGVFSAAMHSGSQSKAMAACG